MRPQHSLTAIAMGIRILTTRHTKIGQNSFFIGHPVTKTLYIIVATMSGLPATCYLYSSQYPGAV